MHRSPSIRRSVVGLSLSAAALLLGPATARAAKFTILHAFSGTSPEGQFPEQAPVVAPSGTLFGTAPDGGQYQDGVVYALAPPARKTGAWTGGTIYSFGAASGGGVAPIGGLVLSSDGSLYGTTTIGGANNQGSAFRLSQSGGVWSETTLFDFDSNGDIGWLPYAGPLMDSSGALYGTTYGGGAHNDGVVYRLVDTGGSRWAETVLHDFGGSGTDGILPSNGALVMDAKGNLYGTTQSGGADGAGVAYELSPPKPGKTAWSETILHGFGGAGDGATLEGGLILGPGGVLYGSTDGGGAGNAQGTIFSLTPPAKGSKSWTETVLYSFTEDGPDGSYPRAGVVRDKHGNLYALTNVGGANMLGTVFRLTAGKAGYAPDDLHDFTSLANKVFGSLTVGPAGVYYGVTYNGGTGQSGTVFSVKP